VIVLDVGLIDQLSVSEMPTVPDHPATTSAVQLPEVPVTAE